GTASKLRAGVFAAGFPIPPRAPPPAVLPLLPRPRPRGGAGVEGPPPPPPAFRWFPLPLLHPPILQHDQPGRVLAAAGVQGGQVGAGADGRALGLPAE